MQGNLPPEAHRRKIEQLQDLQETAQEVAVQKQEAESGLTEAQNALDELENIDEGTTMYRNVGELLVETDYDQAEEDLEEKVDTLEIRLETLESKKSACRTSSRASRGNSRTCSVVAAAWAVRPAPAAQARWRRI